MVVEIVKSQMSVEAGAAFLVLGTDPDRKLRGEDTQAIYGEVVKQTKMGANGMWEVKFDNGETHKLAASWIELKLSTPPRNRRGVDGGEPDARLYLLVAQKTDPPASSRLQ